MSINKTLDRVPRALTGNILSYEHCVVFPEPCAQEGGIAWFSPVLIYCRSQTGYGQSWVETHTRANGNQACFRSVYFGYPVWTPASVVGWGDFDHGFELLTEGGTPTEQSSWGTLKDLYR